MQGMALAANQTPCAPAWTAWQNAAAEAAADTVVAAEAPVAVAVAAETDHAAPEVPAARSTAN